MTPGSPIQTCGRGVSISDHVAIVTSEANAELIVRAVNSLGASRGRQKGGIVSTTATLSNLPWRIDKSNGRVRVVGADGQAAIGYNMADAEARAEVMVRAVNSFESMLEHFRMIEMASSHQAITCSTMPGSNTACAKCLAIHALVMANGKAVAS